jgi:hypothetical protein
MSSGKIKSYFYSSKGRWIQRGLKRFFIVDIQEQKLRSANFGLDPFEVSSIFKVKNIGDFSILIASRKEKN